MVEVDHSAGEPALVEQLELEPKARRQPGGAASHHHRVEELMQLVDQAGPERLGRQWTP